MIWIDLAQSKRSPGSPMVKQRFRDRTGYKTPAIVHQVA